MTLDKKRVEQLALENGFKLKQQEDGTMALNAYVFTFADKLLTEAGGEFAKIIGAGQDTVLLVEAVARIKDLMEGDDGQAWKEARKFLEKLEKPSPAYKCPQEPARKGEAVAYLDLGEGGYMDLGTDLSDEQLSKLPKGRHMLAIKGTYDVEAYKCPAPEGYVQPDEPEFEDGCDYEGFPGGCARTGCKPAEQEDAERFRFLLEQCAKGEYRGILSREAIDAERRKK